MSVQGEVGVAGDGEVVHSKRVQRLVSFQLARHRPCGADLSETVRDEENKDDEEAVCRTLDLEVAEKGVGAEEVEGLVDDIGL